MRVRFIQSGGFAGLVRGCTIQTEALPAEERDRIEALIERARSVVCTAVRENEGAADIGQFELTIDLASGPETLRFDELSVPASITPLLEILKRHAKPLRLDDS